MAGAEALTLTAAQDRPGVARWAFAGVAVLALHAGAGLLLRSAPQTSGLETQPAIEMDLVPPPSGATAPEVAAAANEVQGQETATDAMEPEALEELTAEEVVPPDPDAVTAEETPPEPLEPLDEPVELAETRPDVTPTVALPPEETVTAREERPEPKPEPKPKVARRPVPKPEPREAPVRERARPAPTRQTAGGAGGASNSAGAAASAASTDYTRRIQALVAAAKRYPPSLLSQRVRGRGVVAFTISRSGSVGSVRIVSSAGHPLLDAELQAMVRRANFPPMPADMPGASKAFTIPVSFSVR
ncbi:energy transducer TonB [Methylopila sp. 73B]|uniref:energy transducer TonB n=1 Tax=Methylopila sp. 73B TaxID=1120792 RepID=UPI000375C35D|nr:energy transducer TonB [Methylopila sp. 73B]